MVCSTRQKAQGNGKELYQKFVQCLRHLVFRTRYRDIVTCGFCCWKVDFAVPFLFKLFDFGHPSDKLPMIQSIDRNVLRSKIGVLDSDSGQNQVLLHQFAGSSESSALSSAGLRTAFSTISMISCLTRSKLCALRAGVLQMTLSTLISSSSLPIPPRSMALENLTNTEYFFMIR